MEFGLISTSGKRQVLFIGFQAALFPYPMGKNSTSRIPDEIFKYI
jgi:hypothetical protein